MMSTISLVSLACAIANQGPINTQSLEAQVSDADQVKIQAIIDSGTCLPENMEKLLQSSKQRVESGDLQNNSIMAFTTPSDGCF